MAGAAGGWVVAHGGCCWRLDGGSWRLLTWVAWLQAHQPSLCEKGGDPGGAFPGMRHYHMASQPHAAWQRPCSHQHRGAALDSSSLQSTHTPTHPHTHARIHPAAATALGAGSDRYILCPLPSPLPPLPHRLQIQQSFDDLEKELLGIGQEMDEAQSALNTLNKTAEQLTLDEAGARQQLPLERQQLPLEHTGRPWLLRPSSPGRHAGGRMGGRVGGLAGQLVGGRASRYRQGGTSTPPPLRRLSPAALNQAIAKEQELLTQQQELMGRLRSEELVAEARAWYEAQLRDRFQANIHK